MLRLARHLSGMIGARRLAVVLGVLASFAVVVSLATVLVMMALGFLANRANELDEERTRQTVFGALSTMRNSMVTTVRDYAVWDDAVAAVYGTTDMPWLIANMGLATEGGPLFDTVFLVDETGRTMLAYRNGAPVKADARSYGGAAFLEMHRKILRAGLEPGAELGVFLQTPDGPAVGAASAIRPVSSAVEAPSEALRTLFIIRHLTPARISRIADNFLISGLLLAESAPSSGPAVPLADPDGKTLGFLSWTPDAPGNQSYAQVRPLVLLALAGVVVFFALLVLTGAAFAIRLKADENTARTQALTDRLSGLKNRTGLYLGLDELTARARAEERDVVMLYLDLDGFKDVNDFYGHAVGDRLIRGVSAGLSRLVPAKAMLARIGGDEFAIAFIDRPDGPEAERLTRSILDFFSEPFAIGERVAVVGASIGIAVSRKGAVGGEELLRRADVAMYRAKHAGRGRAMHYETLMDDDRDERREMEEALRAAVARGEIDVVFQPIVGARSRTICGVEALARWYRGGTKPVPPGVFIPLAEATGIIDALGPLILRRACAAVRNWPDIDISINVSPAQFRNPYFPDQALGIIAEAGIAPSRVTLEITEGYFIQNPGRAKLVMDRLKAGGVRIALDDFGAGFSSIGYLIRFGFDRMKIDRSLTVAGEQSPKGGAMLQATVALAASFDMPVTAEGVETAEQAAFLHLCGCDQLQGYFFGKPMSERAISDLLAPPVDVEAAAG
ncbi:bifunctional diguanylate cyclase/phosphodiesterase [Shinella yambaruensis]|uniref:Bifunctional diguanylate cyclase/phosphodiesterase n=1 Tax=Shinella yambaruensis TaxID=415996 RepID=A0ABQ5ZI17_9HYPH|nr:bifunctional diguanylate cyclase/phosphodiesterase [Shinella yambaruensis]MCJ8026818.1 bifunctional diguanylate cyclase/phosphodiesterase [Shinella yambaruensis]MCU7983026.1 bifunctional diguanylate cyclase/phosphodiesterase [Shinella yambaruensis]GLR51467.1 bifunctional diguanylate cyclase/phosphodiesterase [Shinella yambaruensis]